MSQTEQDNSAAYGKIVAQAWRDPAFKAKLLADPHAALKEAGVPVPAGVTVKVVENTEKQFHLVLPPKPSGKLSEADLDKVAGGGLWHGMWRDIANHVNEHVNKYGNNDALR